MIKTLCLVNAGESEDYPKLEWNDFVFDINRVVLFTKEVKDNYTNIKIEADEMTTVAIKYEDFLKLINIEKIVIDAKADYEFKGQ